jgi:hypothetical protein
VPGSGVIATENYREGLLDRGEGVSHAFVTTLTVGVVHVTVIDDGHVLP